MRCEAVNCTRPARFQCVLGGRYVFLCEDCRTCLLTPYRQSPQIEGEETDGDDDGVQYERPEPGPVPEL